MGSIASQGKSMEASRLSASPGPASVPSSRRGSPGARARRRAGKSSQFRQRAITGRLQDLLRLGCRATWFTELLHRPNMPFPINWTNANPFVGITATSGNVLVGSLTYTAPRDCTQIDDIERNPPNTSPVPEPATLTLL